MLPELLDLLETLEPPRHAKPCFGSRNRDAAAATVRNGRISARLADRPPGRRCRFWHSTTTWSGATTRARASSSRAPRHNGPATASSSPQIERCACSGFGPCLHWHHGAHRPSPVGGIRGRRTPAACRAVALLLHPHLRTGVGRCEIPIFATPWKSIASGVNGNCLTGGAMAAFEYRQAEEIRDALASAICSSASRVPSCSASPTRLRTLICSSTRTPPTVGPWWMHSGNSGSR